MEKAINIYDAKVDSKKRITLRNTKYEYYHVEEMGNGRILLEPRVLAEPSMVREDTLNMMDYSMKNYKEGKVSKAIDLSDFEDK